MKPKLSLLLLLGLLIPFSSWAAVPDFVAFDSATSNVEIISDNQKVNTTINLGPKPARLIKLPEENGYLIMYRGSTKFLLNNTTPGGLIFLDQQFKPISKNLSLPGIVIADYYLQADNSLLLITATGSNENPKGAISLCNLKTSSVQHLNLDSLPSVFRLTPDQKQLAIATIGNNKNKISPKLHLIDLASGRISSFPVSANPGGIYFLNNNKLMVACAGSSDFRKFFENIIIGDTPEAVPAKLHFIDPVTAQNNELTLGYAPLTVVQDKQNPDLFYTASSKAPESDPPGGIFMKVSPVEIISRLDLPGEPLKMIQSPQGNLCLQARSDFLLISPQEPKLVSRINFELKPESLLLNATGTVGYLTAVNSSYLTIIDLISGKHSQLQIGKSRLVGELRIAEGIFKTKTSLVAGFDPFPSDNSSSVSPNYRLFLADNQAELYAINASSFITVDLKTNQIKSRTNYRGNFFGIHPTPNHKFIILATDIKWYLLDPKQKDPVLEINLSAKDEPAPAVGFYSPDGNLLVIPTEFALHLVDTQSGKYLGKIRTKTTFPVIQWPR